MRLRPMRAVIVLWAVLMYVGQVAKDLLRLPRPASPRVARLEVHYSAEYGMPSTHAAAAASVPWYLAITISDRIDTPAAVLAAVCVAWFLATCMSRL